MIKQKVISVNIALTNYDSETGVGEMEFDLLNKHLADGYIVADRFSTVSNAKQGLVVNLTFILQKEEQHISPLQDQ